MPTNERVHAAIVEVSEGLSQIGYETRDVVGPITQEGEEVATEDIESFEEDLMYYLTGDANGASFYILFELNRNYASIVYPMNVLRHLGSYLTENEIESLLDEPIKWDKIESGEQDQLSMMAAKQIVESTEPAHFHRAAFNLSVYASTSLVNYHQTTTEEGFPTEFQCARGLFPYSEKMSISRLDDRVHPVIIAGERGRRYMEYSFRIDMDDKTPDEYRFQSLL